MFVLSFYKMGIILFRFSINVCKLSTTIIVSRFTKRFIVKLYKISVRVLLRFNDGPRILWDTQAHTQKAVRTAGRQFKVIFIKSLPLS